jgi:hypothetical protein
MECMGSQSDSRRVRLSVPTRDFTPHVRLFIYSVSDTSPLYQIVVALLGAGIATGYGTHWIGGWVDPRAGLDDVDTNYKFWVFHGFPQSLQTNILVLAR